MASNLCHRSTLTGNSISRSPHHVASWSAVGRISSILVAIRARGTRARSARRSRIGPVLRGHSRVEAGERLGRLVGHRQDLGHRARQDGLAEIVELPEIEIADVENEVLWRG